MSADAAMVILSIPKVMDIAGFTIWIHYTQVEKLEVTDAVSHNVGPLNVRFIETSSLPPMLLYFLLSLRFDMNTGSWSNSRQPSGLDLGTEKVEGR